MVVHIGFRFCTFFVISNNENLYFMIYEILAVFDTNAFINIIFLKHFCIIPSNLPVGCYIVPFQKSRQHEGWLYKERFK